MRAAEQLRPDVAARRAAWRAAQPELAGRRLIFLDETGAATDMTRRRGWAPVGARVVGYAPAGHWRTTTFLAGLAAEALVAPFVLDGPINRAIFTEYARRVSVPARGLHCSPRPWARYCGAAGRRGRLTRAPKTALRHLAPNPD